MTKQKKLLLTAALTAAMALPAAAMAQARGDAGFYLGGSIGQTTAKDWCNGLAGSGASCDDKDSSWRILGGYQINRNFAAELGYVDLGKVTASLGAISASAESTAWELVGIGAFPITNQFSIYGKLGMYRAEVEARANAGALSGSDKKNNNDLTYGAGVQYDVNRQLGLRAEWQRYSNMGDNATIGETNVDVMSVGLLWHFR
jgi:OOP family OmpA-OmpF porin